MNLNSLTPPRADWRGMFEHSPAEDLVEVVADVLPDDVAAILALTPHVADDATWEEREAAARAASEEGAIGLHASMTFFVEKKLIYEDDGNVLWA